MISTITVTINGQHIQALIDSGATHNFISTNIAQDYKRDPRTLTLADHSTTCPVLGRTTQRFEINTGQFQEEFLVTKRLSHHVILGEPWLMGEQVLLDFHRGCFHAGIDKRTTYFLDRPEPSQQEAKPKDLEPIPNGFPEEFQGPLQDMFCKFKTVMSNDSGATTGTTKHKLRLAPHARPFRCQPYKYPAHKKEIIAREVEKMLKDGIIEPSSSNYSSPIVLVKKKDGSPRFCVDYRKLNGQILDEASALPIINEVLRDLSSAKIFSVLDLKNGYWQVPMDDNSKRLTAFTTPDGATFQFRRMPFGLKNAPATFQNMMTQEVLPGYLRQFAVVYLDDVIIYSNNWEDHINHIQRVLERLQTHNLRLAPEKCKIGQTSCEYLGHRIVPGGIEPLPVHLEQIRNATRPGSKKQLRKFLGLCGWLRDFIPKFAETAQPLTDLLRGNKPFKWPPLADVAFARIKEELEKPLYLHRPDYSKPFTLQTDASGRGIAAVLYQGTSDNKRIVSFASKRLDQMQERYHSNELECLAVIWAMKHYRPYLEDRHFILRTDNRNLLWLKSMTNQNAKLTRWAILTQEFNYTVEHVSGDDNQLPDFLSREPSEDQVEEPDSEALSPPTQDDNHALEEGEPFLAVIATADLVDTVKEAQRQNEIARGMIARWNEISNNGPTNPEEQSILERFEVHDEALWYKENGRRRLLVPVEVAEHVLHVYHDSPTAGHPGAEETCRSIKENYYWISTDGDVKKYVGACWVCASFKRGPLQNKAPLRPHEPTLPWEVAAVDLMGPYVETTNGNRFVLVVTDMFSRWVEAFPLQKSDAETVTRTIDREIFSRYGYPRAILSDNGPQFTSMEWDSALRRWGCLHWTTPIFHPQANPTERRIQEVKKCIRLQLQGQNPNTWDQHVSTALLNIRSRQNAATKQTPAALLLGYDLKKPGEWFLQDPAQPEGDREVQRQERIRQAHMNEHRYRQRYAGNIPPPVRFTAGDLVMERDSKVPLGPFAPRWHGPHTVIEEAGPNTYWIRRLHKVTPTKVHVNDLRPAPPPRQQ